LNPALSSVLTFRPRDKDASLLSPAFLRGSTSYNQTDGGWECEPSKEAELRGRGRFQPGRTWIRGQSDARRWSRKVRAGGDGRTMRQTNASSMISSRTCFRYSPRLIQPLGHARHSTISAYRARTVLTEIERDPFARSNTFEVPPSGQQAVTLREGIAWERSSIGQRFRTHRRQIRAKRVVMTNQRLCQSTGL
jgi:hypothetical protein